MTFKTGMLESTKTAEPLIPATRLMVRMMFLPAHPFVFKWKWPMPPLPTSEVVPSLVIVTSHVCVGVSVGVFVGVGVAVQ
jgi:hypothetical protein